MEISEVVAQDMKAWPGKSSYVVNVAGCDLKCAWCNAKKHVECTSFVSKHDAEKILKSVWSNNGVVITGGEPCRFMDLGIFCKKLRLRNLRVRVETNGLFPERIKNLLDKKVVNYIALDVKAPFSKYEKYGGHLSIEKSVEVLKNSGVDYECRTTFVDLSEDDVVQIGKDLKGVKKFVLQGFVPGECIDSNYNTKAQSEWEELKRVAAKVDGPEQVRVRLGVKEDVVEREVIVEAPTDVEESVPCGGEAPKTIFAGF